MPTISPISELSLRYGKYHGKNKYGIQVFKKVNAKGNTVVNAIKNSELYKSIENISDTTSEITGCIFDNREIRLYNHSTHIQTKVIKELCLENDEIISEHFVCNHSKPYKGEMLGTGEQYLLSKSLTENKNPETINEIMKFCNEPGKEFGHLGIGHTRIDYPDGTYTIETNICADGYIMPDGTTRAMGTIKYLKTFSADGTLLYKKKIPMSSSGKLRFQHNYSIKSENST